MKETHIAIATLRLGLPPQIPSILMIVCGSRHRKDSFRSRDIGARPRKQAHYRQGRGPFGRLDPDHKIRLHPLLANQKI